MTEVDVLNNGRSEAAAVSALTSLSRRRAILSKNQARQKRRARLSPQATLREVMSRFATGVTVLTAGNGDASHGMTANAFTSVSLDPPLVLCCVSRAARMHETILSADSFAVSILGADQLEVAKYFADWQRPSGRAQFDAVHWERGQRTGAPLLAGALAWLECELVKAYDGGDHSIFLGEVLSSHRNTDPGGTPPADTDALLFFAGDFHRLNNAA